MIKPRLYKGMRDYLPMDMIPRETLLGRIRNTFKKWGFVPIETPAIEYTEVLMGSKMGTEATKLLYHIKHDDGLALRYDLTVPLARMYAMNRRDLPNPFKRYQIQPVWRAERAQPRQGRFREFYQCDVDILGSKSLLADTEIVALSANILLDIGFTDVEISINHRALLRGITEDAGFTPDDELTVCGSIDKLDKIGEDGVRKELDGKGFSSDKIDKLFALMNLTLDKYLESSNERIRKGAEELRDFFALFNNYKLPESIVKFSPVLARGLDYYTGIIFETRATNLPHIGSLSGGGRYDGLIGEYSGQSVPAVGITIGLDRILVAANELGIIPKENTSTKVLITYFDKTCVPYSIEIANTLRNENIATEVFLDEKKKIGKMMTYADKLGIPVVIVVGPDELSSKTAQLKELSSGEQTEVSFAEIAQKVKDLL